VSEGENFIVPQRLPGENDTYGWQSEGDTVVRFEYKFLPKGILTRLICRMNSIIERDPELGQRVWCDAVIFSISGGKGKVFAREVYAQNVIELRATGEKRAEMLNQTIQTLDDIKLKLFISYSKHDVHHKDTLLKHLSGLRDKIVTWHDRDILPGEDWDERIKAALHEADVVLYLVTHDSIATDYIQQVELPLVEERCAAGECILVPVIVDFCFWTELDFARRNALPEKGVPVTDVKWKNENEAWVKVVEGVQRILASWRLPTD
jgi:hypothetical protein